VADLLAVQVQHRARNVGGGVEDGGVVQITVLCVGLGWVGLGGVGWGWGGMGFRGASMRIPSAPMHARVSQHLSPPKKTMRARIPVQNASASNASRKAPLSQYSSTKQTFEDVPFGGVGVEGWGGVGFV